MDKKPIRREGFTLIELIFAITLLGLMLTLVIQTYIGVFRFYVWAGTTRTNQAAARQVMDRLTREIKAKTIVLSSSNNAQVCLRNSNLTSTRIAWDSNPAVLRLRKDEFDSQNCTGSLSVPSSFISADNVKIGQFEITYTAGAVGTNVPAQGVVVDLQTVNGISTARQPGGPGTAYQCDPGDNFCDVASYETAITAEGSTP